MQQGRTSEERTTATTPPEEPFILFDDSLAGVAQLFAGPKALHVAWSPEELPDCFAALEEERARGRYLAGYASYELGYALEPRLLPLMPAKREAPLLCFAAFEAPRPQEDAETLLKGERASLTLPRGRALLSLEDYRARFDRARALIGAGDVYQINLTFPIALDLAGSPLAAYRQIRVRQPVAYGAFVQLAGPTLLSFSPELFFEVADDGRITARPMKGTIRRGADAREDLALAAHLAQDEKNRAENLMIVDLLRNDLSRLSEIGSVKVPALFEVERYATLHQMVSRIEGRLEGAADLARLFAALFPCGSITGAPKIRAMEIIRALELWPRGVYCGTIGWIAPEGAEGPRMRFNVAIRTISMTAGEGAQLAVGSGLVYDSDAEAEYRECLLKARFAATLD